jgi:hypothetical protein
VCARQPGDNGRVGPQCDRVSGREWAAEVRHRDVLVERPAALERDVVHDGGVLDPDCEDDQARRIRELPAEPRKLARLAVGDLVVDGDPAVPRRGHDRRGRTENPGNEPRDRLYDGGLVVGLEMDRSVRGRPLRLSRRGSSLRRNRPQQCERDAFARLAELEHHASARRELRRADHLAVLLGDVGIAFALDVHPGSRFPRSR